MKYKVGFDDSGLIKSAKIYIYINGGYSHDLSLAVRFELFVLVRPLISKGFNLKNYIYN